jgi:hypothetical protein
MEEWNLNAFSLVSNTKTSKNPLHTMRAMFNPCPLCSYSPSHALLFSLRTPYLPFYLRAFYEA